MFSPVVAFIGTTAILCSMLYFCFSFVGAEMILNWIAKIIDDYDLFDLSYFQNALTSHLVLIVVFAWSSTNRYLRIDR